MVLKGMPHHLSANGAMYINRHVNSSGRLNTDVGSPGLEKRAPMLSRFRGVRTRWNYAPLGALLIRLVTAWQGWQISTPEASPIIRIRGALSLRG